jgi:hypothetical protein
MRKHVKPEVFSYHTDETSFETTDKELAILVYEYAKGRASDVLKEIRADIISSLNSKIKRLKTEIKKTNGSD